VPTLIARDAGVRTPIRLPLLLPAGELRALADAVGPGHVAEQLRRS
jgi:hypothetical protein